MAEDYEGMTVAELKALLKEQGLPVSGKKADLIERLSGAQEEVPEPEDDATTEVQETVEEATSDGRFLHVALFRPCRSPAIRARLQKFYISEQADTFMRSMHKTYNEGLQIALNI